MTCGLFYKQCPGHMGHIELPVSVFNPLYFQTVYYVRKINRNLSWGGSKIILIKLKVIEGNIIQIKKYFQNYDFPVIFP